LTPSVSKFVNSYLKEGREMRAYLFSPDPERDSKIAEYYDNKIVTTYDDRRRNCATACGDALRAAEVLGISDRPERGILYDSPARLQGALESGVLSNHVLREIIFDPGNVQEVYPEQILDLFGIKDVPDPDTDI